MVCKVVLMVIGSVLLATQPSTSSPIENEKLVKYILKKLLIIYKLICFQMKIVGLKTGRAVKPVQQTSK